MPDTAIPAVSLVDRGSDLLLHSAHALPSGPAHIGHYLRSWARRSPDRSLFAEWKRGGGWTALSYRDASVQADSTAQWLLDVRRVPGAPVLTIAPNSTRLAVVLLGAMQCGIPVVPASPKYLRSTSGRAFLKDILARTGPFAVYVDSDSVDAKDLDWLRNAASGCLLMTSSATPQSDAMYVEFANCRPDERVETAFRAVRGSDAAKILFTSGSTGIPKGVVNTHGMLVAQQEQMAALWKFLDARPPVLVDWLPWNHTSGGNNSFNMTLRNGGTLYIDPGVPTDSGIELTVTALRSVSPTWYTNVPLGYSLLLPYLRDDREFGKCFFGNLDLLIYGGASLSNEVWKGISSACEMAVGAPVAWGSGYGLTETTSTTTITHFPVHRAGNIGLPLPGMLLKLVPAKGAYQLYVKGPNVTPGYHHDPTATESSFDEEGFFDTGDFVKFAEPGFPERGLVYEGRIKEQFKLANGAWIVPGRLRSELLAYLGPRVKDVVLAGPDRPYLVAILWLADSLYQGRVFAENDVSGGDAAWIVEGLRRYNLAHASPKERIQRVQVVIEPPNEELGELTEKGSINQIAFQKNRQQTIAGLYDGAS